MRYEKKMLILSGVGKGVVLMEKSALGVKFALRTFSIPAEAGLKVGVVTRSCAVVRELPDCADPSLVFYIDDSALDLNYLHFAVFDSSLKLYGATGKRMWESNLMDILIKADRSSAPPPMLERSPSLAPIGGTPLKPLLPDPDGSGNPQLRALYGDDLIAGEDYYTPFNITSRMKEIDGFLDTPRVLDGLSPHIQKISPQNDAPQSEVPQSEVPQSIVRQSESLPNPSVAPSVIKAQTEAEKEEPETESEAEKSEEAEMADMTKTDTETKQEDLRSDDDSVEQSDVMSEAAATAEVVPVNAENNIEPWKRCAEYLKTICTGEICVRRETVVPVAQKTQVKRVREASFFERCRADVDKLFSSAAKDGELNAILPDIEFVKVPFDGHTVSVGRGGDVFLCYAVPGVYEKVSPLGSEAQWLPKHKNAPTGKGYWLIFQDLKSGGIIGA